MSLDDNNFSKRVKRYGQVTGGVGKLATQFLTKKMQGAGDDFPELLVAWLGNLKGPLVKVGQILAMIPDFLPPAYQEKLLELQSNAPEMGWLFVKRRMRAELGNNWEEQFQSFSHKAVAAASLGQVHKATGLDGTDLACKLQYPNMEVAVSADLDQLSFFLNGYHFYNKALDHADILKEIRLRLMEELDYSQEAENARRFQSIFRSHQDIHIPSVCDHLSTKRLLTMTWCEGTSFQDFFDAPFEVRNKLAAQLFVAWYYPLYTHGILHGDPHFGNYKVMENGQLGILDFGCVRYFSPEFVLSIIDLYWSLVQNDEALAVQAYEGLGFKRLTKDLIKTLNLWATYLYGPILENKVRPVEASFSSKEGRAIATNVYQQLRQLGGIRPPQEFVFLDRSALVLGSVFMHLKAECNWHNLFHKLIDGIDAHKVSKNQEIFLRDKV